MSLGGAFHLIELSIDISAATECAEDKSEREVAEIRCSDLGLLEEYMCAREGFAEGEGVINLACRIPLLICRIDVEGKAEIPCETITSRDATTAISTPRLLSRFAKMLYPLIAHITPINPLILAVMPIR